MKEFINEEKTQAEKIEVRLNPRFNWGDDEVGKTMEEEDISLGTIHMIRGSNHPNLENKK